MVTGMITHGCNPSYVSGISRKIMVEISLPEKKRPYLKKITKARRVRGMKQVVEHLPNKRKALGSNLSTAKAIIK
jgi:hypothetical protein